MSSFSGSEPDLSRSASCLACWKVKPPEISEPLPPEMPSGYSWKLIVGDEMTWSSRTIAKWFEQRWARWPCVSPAAGMQFSAPRWAIVRVTSFQTSLPREVKSKTTLGWLAWPGCEETLCAGFFTSSPVSAGRSRRTNHLSPAGIVS